MEKECKRRRGKGREMKWRSVSRYIVTAGHHILAFSFRTELTLWLVQ